MQLGPESVQLVVEACTYLHNLMCERQQAIMHELEQVAAPNRDTRAGKQLREYLRLYFNSAADC